MKIKAPFDMRLEAKSPVPVYEQIKRAVRLAVLSGALTAESRLPSIRELALKLKVNPNTVIKSFYQLEVEGFIYSRPGAGYFVRLDPETARRQGRKMFSQLTEDYIVQAVNLGFSAEDIRCEISHHIPPEGERDPKGG